MKIKLVFINCISHCVRGELIQNNFLIFSFFISLELEFGIRYWLTGSQAPLDLSLARAPVNRKTLANLLPRLIADLLD